MHSGRRSGRGPFHKLKFTADQLLRKGGIEHIENEPDRLTQTKQDFTFCHEEDVQK